MPATPLTPPTSATPRSSATTRPQVGAVVLDLGGVVTRIARTWHDRARAAGLQLRDVERCEAALVACWDTLMAMQRGEVSTEQLAQKICAEAGHVHTTDEVVAALNSQLLGPFPGVLDVVVRLKVPHAIFSNTSADHWQILLKYDVVRLAKWRLASFQLGLVKPEPASYAAVESAMGMSGSQLLFFDDSQQNVDSARASGWHAERVDPFGDVAAQLETHLLDYDALRDAL